jgi:hypothetical protein
VLEDFGRDMEKIGEAFRVEGPTARLASFTTPAIDTTAFDEMGERIAAEKRKTVEREEAMLREMAATRKAVERAEGRADDAEGREGEALNLARRNFWVAVIATVAAVLSLAATVLVAVLA